MNYLSLEFSEADGTVFHLTTESYISIFLWKLLNAQEEIRIKLVQTKFETITAVQVNLVGIKYELCSGKVNGKLPMLELDGCHVIIGLCSVLRGVCRLMKPGRLATQLLGFKENCLMSPSEVSNWTNFCEREMIQCTEQLRRSSGEIQFPIEMIKFERDLANPVRVHNVYKAVRKQNNDKSIKSGTIVNLEHKFCHGDEANLADFMLYSIYKLIFSAVNTEDVVDILPLTLKWFKNMESENFEETYTSLMRGTDEGKANSLMFSGEIPQVNEDGKYFSLLNRWLTGYKNKNRRGEFTDQSELEVVLEKLKQSNVDVHSAPGEEDQSAISDDFVQELLESGQLPMKRLDRKKSQLKSLANEVLKIAKRNDVIVDFASGTGHLGFLIAKLLPACRVIVLENKEESINRARGKAQKLELDNVTFYQCNLVSCFDRKASTSHITHSESFTGLF